MTSAPQSSDPALGEGWSEEPGLSRVTVRFWAGARAAAGTAELEVSLPGPVTVATLTAYVVATLADRPALPRVLEVCSVLVGDRPAHDADEPVQTGATVEFLPPFAGG